MPPAAGSRSSTATEAMPRSRSRVAAARPAGPPPTTATSTSGGRTRASVGIGGLRRDLEPGGEAAGGDPRQDAEAAEALAAAHGDAGAPLPPGKAAGGQGTLQGVLDLAAGHQLAVADDAAVPGRGPGARPVLSEAGRRRPVDLRRRLPVAGDQPRDLLGQAQRTAEAGRADAADADV